jgi:hypothetical protein
MVEIDCFMKILFTCLCCIGAGFGILGFIKWWRDD